jgi:myo-inositol-1(or 4)-monophosphatase
MSLPDIERLQQLVIRVAREEILPRFNRVTGHDKADGSVLTEADVVAQARLQEGLAGLSPLPLLGEEMDETEQRRLLRESDGLWCLDPLDGTSNFASGLPFFCTSLALIQRGIPMLAVIYDPVRDECFTAQRDQGARLNGEPLHSRTTVSEMAKAIAEVDLKRLPARLAQRLAAEHPFRSQRNFGSGALDWAWLATGRYQLYLHGGQKLWDYMGGCLILEEAGGRATTLEGEAVPCHQLVPRSVVAAADESLYAQWYAWLTDLT